MSSSESLENEEFIATPPDVIDAAKIIQGNLLPTKSKDRYISVYDSFVSWKREKSATSFSENVLTAYFGEIAKKYKPSSLWAIYSMLKSTLKSKHNVNIEKYVRLTTFLKRQSDGYIAKKSKILTGENIEQFIKEAPDNQYLATKVALILGVNGALRRQELSEITTNDIEDHGDIFVVKIPNTKNKVPRSFVVEGQHFQIMKKYQSLRSEKGTSNRFFQQFRNGKCTTQLIGKNKFGTMAKEIAEYLNLPDANQYTGHSFRRTSATLLADSGADILTLKRHGGWKSNNVAEGYIDDSINNKREISNRISTTILKSCKTYKSDPQQALTTEPQPSTSYALTKPQPLPSFTDELDFQTSPTFTMDSQVSQPSTAHITNNNNLSQKIRLPEKNTSLTFNHCTVSINYNYNK